MAPFSSTEIAITSAWNCEASSCNGVSVRAEGLMKARGKYANAVECEMEASKVHWSEVADATSDDDDENLESDVEVFVRLQKTWGYFFQDSYSMEVGEKIAEGGQAEIFNAQWKYIEWEGSVLKVMKEGFRLRDLEKQWPLDTLCNSVRDGAYISGNSCLIFGATLFEKWKVCILNDEDLQKLIDLRIECNKNQRPPFTNEEVEHIVKEIAQGMEQLHAYNTVHRDLKASNVLIDFDGEKVDLEKFNFEYVDVADFKCSIGVVAIIYIEDLWRFYKLCNNVISNLNYL